MQYGGEQLPITSGDAWFKLCSFVMLNIVVHVGDEEVSFARCHHMQYRIGVALNMDATCLSFFTRREQNRQFNREGRYGKLIFLIFS